MKIRIAAPIFLLVFGILALWALPDRAAESSGNSADYSWKAAVAKADITPEPGIWLAGYSARKGPAEKVRQPIHAKALALEDAEGGRFVFLTLDLIGVPRPFRDAVEKRAGEKHGLAPEAILINASHTHSGPMIRLYRPPKGGGEERAPYANIPDEEQELRVRQTREYNARLLETADRLIGEALASPEPAKVSWSHAKCGFAMNRRTPAGPGVWKNAPNPDAPVDHEVPVLQVRSKPDGKLKAVMFGYACHATVLSLMEIHGDWPGYAQHYFEERHPETVALFLNGCSGDQNPYPRRLPYYVERHGQSMATAIEAALETKAHPLAGPLRSAIAWPEIPYQEPPTRAELEEKAKSKDRYDARHGQFLLDVLDTAGGFPESYPVPVQVVRFGDDLTVVALGGEAVVDYSLRLKREIGELTGGAPVWVAAYSNDVMTYIPSKRVLEEGGYEGGGAMRYVRSTVHPAPWHESIEERLVGKAKELTASLK